MEYFFENLIKLKESIDFRFTSIFSFKNMSPIAVIVKITLLLIFGLPFIILEALGFVIALICILPLINIILQFTIGLIIDLLTGGLFYLIMIPEMVEKKRSN